MWVTSCPSGAPHRGGGGGGSRAGMEGGDSVLDAVLDEEALDYDGDDVEMADADDAVEEAQAQEDPVAITAPTAAATGGGGGGGEGDGGVGQAGKNKNKKKKRKKSARTKNKGKPDGPPKIADINRYKPSFFC